MGLVSYMTHRLLGLFLLFVCVISVMSIGFSGSGGVAGFFLIVAILTGIAGGYYMKTGSFLGRHH